MQRACMVPANSNNDYRRYSNSSHFDEGKGLKKPASSTMLKPVFYGFELCLFCIHKISLLFVGFERWTGTHEVAIPKGIVDPAHTNPEFMSPAQVG